MDSLSVNIGFILSETILDGSFDKIDRLYIPGTSFSLKLHDVESLKHIKISI